MMLVNPVPCGDSGFSISLSKVMVPEVGLASLRSQKLPLLKVYIGRSF